jgi:hypothetical protein
MIEGKNRSMAIRGTCRDVIASRFLRSAASAALLAIGLRLEHLIWLGTSKNGASNEYDSTYYSWSPSRNPFGPVEQTGLKVLRGGSWVDPGPGDFAILRSKAGRNQVYTGIGFRVFRELISPDTGTEKGCVGSAEVPALKDSTLAPKRGPDCRR